MLKNVTVNSDVNDLGSVAEAVAYYSKTHVVVGGGGLRQLLIAIGSDGVRECLEYGTIDFSFERNNYVVLTHSEPFEMNKFVSGQHHPQRQKHRSKQIMSDKEYAEWSILETLGKSKKSKDFARRFIENATFNESNSSVIAAANNDMKDKTFATVAARTVIEYTVPGYKLPDDFYFEVGSLDDQLIVAANIDFDEAKEVYHRTVSPENSSMSKAHLLAHIIRARSLLQEAVSRNSSLLCDELSARLLSTRVEQVIRRVSKEKRSIELLEEITLNGKDVASIVNNDPAKFIEVIRAANSEDGLKYKKWIDGAPHDASIIDEYFKAVHSKGVFGSAKFKASKIAVMAGIGVAVDAAVGTMGAAAFVGTVLGAAADMSLSSSDEFLLSKVLKGWNPSYYIDKRLKPILGVK